MGQREGERLLEALVRDPENVDRARELALWLERNPEASEDFLRPELLTPLLRMIAARPGAEDLQALTSPLLGLELVEPEKPPAWWNQGERLGEGPYRDLETGLPLEIRRRLDDAEMVLIPPGPGTRGSNEEATEKPVHRLELDGLYLDRRPVCWGQYMTYLRLTGSPPPPDWDVAPAKPDAPLRGLTWEEARDYARWVGGRLPTEAELARAVRGTQGHRFPWGDTPYGWNEAGERPPFGLQDGYAGLWNWCEDAFHSRAFSESTLRNPFQEEAEVLAPTPGDELERLLDLARTKGQEAHILELYSNNNYSYEAERDMEEKAERLRHESRHFEELHHRLTALGSGPCKVLRPGPSACSGSPPRRCTLRRPAPPGTRSQEIVFRVAYSLSGPPSQRPAPAGIGEAARAAAEDRIRRERAERRGRRHRAQGAQEAREAREAPGANTPPPAPETSGRRGPLGDLEQLFGEVGSRFEDPLMGPEQLLRRGASVARGMGSLVRGLAGPLLGELERELRRSREDEGDED